jgi:hypothetical protein
MGDPPETKPRENITPPPRGDGGIDWDVQPASLTTREVAALLGKSPGNVRARASKGDFGPTMNGPDGLPRYDRDRVRIIGERMAARQAQARPQPVDLSNAPLTLLLTALQAQQSEQISLYKAWLEEAQEAARQAKEDARELRVLLGEREETTRETLSHMDMLHDQSITQMKDAVERERTQWAQEVVAKEAEIERLRAEPTVKKTGPQLWRK